MYYLLLGSVLPEFDENVVIYVFRFSIAISDSRK
jgi:hypothetical protein